MLLDFKANNPINSYASPLEQWFSADGESGPTFFEVVAQIYSTAFKFVPQNKTKKTLG